MKNKILATILMVVILLTSGCGTSNYVVDKNNKPIKYEITGQYLQKNILCQPNDKELYKLYKKYDKQLKTSVDDLPQCTDYKINSNKSTGLCEFIFVKPLAWIIIQIGKIVKNYGLAIIIITLMIKSWCKFIHQL